MKTLIPLLVPASLLLLVACSSTSSSSHGSQPPEIFVSRHGIADTVVKELAKATNSVAIHTRSFPDAPIAAALVDAHRRGVEVFVVLNRNPDLEPDSQAAVLAKAGIPVAVDGWHAKSQSNILIIDQYKVLGNPFRWNSAAKRPNLLVVVDRTAAAKAARNCRTHQQHAERYTCR